MKQPKPKKCVICNQLFKPNCSTAKVCGFNCAVEYTFQVKAKKERKEYRVAKEKIKTRQDWLKEAQTAFNSFVRHRDSQLPCISCQRHHAGQYHAGHYRASGAWASLRFNEDNCHKQCQPCNTMKSGNLLEYRINLIKKIGQDRVDWLEGPHQPAKWTIDQLKQIKAEYKAKLKELLND